MATKRYHPAILVSCEIPWDDGENLIEDVFRQEIRATLAQFDNLYIFGTAGACRTRWATSWTGSGSPRRPSAT